MVKKLVTTWMLRRRRFLQRTEVWTKGTVRSICILCLWSLSNLFGMLIPNKKNVNLDLSKICTFIRNVMNVGLLSVHSKTLGGKFETTPTVPFKITAFTGERGQKDFLFLLQDSQDTVVWTWCPSTFFERAFSWKGVLGVKQPPHWIGIFFLYRNSSTSTFLQLR